jgi:hypothetical protein
MVASRHARQAVFFSAAKKLVVIQQRAPVIKVHDLTLTLETKCAHVEVEN